MLRSLSLTDPCFNSRIAASAVVASRPTTKLGMNVAPPEDYGSSFPFKQMMRQGRNWTSQISGADGGSLTLDAQGWPTSLALNQSARMYWITTVPNVGTPYTLLSHDGAGTFTNSSQNSSGLIWDLTATTNGNHFRNAKIYIPGTSDDGLHPFYQPFLNHLSGYATLRFMDWGLIIGNQLVEWADRIQPDYYTFAGGEGGSGVLPWGAPYEFMIQLCNQLGCDMWFCVPAHASDDFITQAATLIKNTLKTNLKCYYELSNEVWNGVGDENEYFIGIGVADNLDADSFQAGMKAYSRRAVQMFDLVDAVYGSAKSTRRRRVMGGQIGNLGFPVLSFQNAFQKTDYFAVAPYLEVAADITGKTDAQIISLLSQPGDGYLASAADVTASKGFAEASGVKICFYEFGPGASIPASTQRAVGFEFLMRNYLDQVWQQAGQNCPANYYFSCRESADGNAWGAIEDINSQNTAKNRALRYYADGYATLFQPTAPSFTHINDLSFVQNSFLTFTPSVSNPSGFDQLFSLTGSLPTGLTLATDTGAISGTPTIVATTSGLILNDGYSSDNGSGSVSSNSFSIIVATPVSKPVDGYTAWWDPSDSASVTLTSSAVSQMLDLSGNNHTISQSTPVNRPLQTTINGKNALLFQQFQGQSLAGSATVANLLTTTAYTVFAAVRPDTITSNASTANNAVWGDANGSVGLYFKSGGPTAIAYNDDGALDQAAVSVSLASMYVIVVQLSGGNIKIETAPASFTSTASGAITSTSAVMQLGRGSGGDPFFVGALGDVIMYNTALNSTDIATNITYLKQKWNIA